MHEIAVDVYREGTTLTIDAKQPEEATHYTQRPTVEVSQFSLYGVEFYAPGPQGPAAKIAVGTTTTLAPGSPATVVNSGTEYEAIFDFGIPHGEAATATAGTTTTLVPGTPATVVNSGTTGDAVFDFGIPRGSTVVVGTTVTGAPGSAATVTDDDATADVRLNFSIPQGIQGVQGEVAVESTVTGAPGTQASVQDMDASIHKALLRFTIPRGDKGDQGEVAVESTITGGVGTPALVEDLDPSPNKALLRFTIPQGPQGVPGPGGTPGGPAGGDLGGTYPNPTVVKAAGTFSVGGHLTLASLAQIIMPTPTSTVKGRLQTLPNTPDWLGYTLNCAYDPTGWLLDDTSKPGWFFKLDSRTGGNGAEFAVFYIPAGANPHVNEYAVITVKPDGTAVFRNKLTGLIDPTAAQDAATKNYVDVKVGAGGMNRVISVISGATSAAGTAKTDYMYICTAALTLTLPTAVGNTNLYTVKRTGTGNVTVATTSSQTIDGTTTFVIDVQYMAVNFVSDGANWVVC